tara:strand:- start:2836 stop:3213 length:378 start_codon:yes stop_codon:yes gene_type:complete
MGIQTHLTFKDLAPMITRRRLVIEGLINNNLTNSIIVDYMNNLSNVMNMTIVTNPKTNYVNEYGWSAYMSWKESGMHVYTWEETNERPNFISIDIYTCKDFDLDKVIDFTKKSFKDYLTEITWRE